ncbi:hypothetical protein BS47DRAFT_32301 [Hydnum rufescens UP504]|uniref:Uncharacterized protein n=1 Tax=Hydnum rufescens UP504 TaxID=1448309 RepID=A0A9P6DZD9_9AGAM|nr:hypothetical protein BS47DRAFT_32301 [Hydnum rufescens UP504]
MSEFARVGKYIPNSIRNAFCNWGSTCLLSGRSRFTWNCHFSMHSTMSSLHLMFADYPSMEISCKNRITFSLCVCIASLTGMHPL